MRLSKKLLTVPFAVLTGLAFSALTAFAASDQRLDTPQGGYVTFTNVSQVQEDKTLKDTIYIAESPITITIHGQPAKVDFGYYPENGNPEIIDFSSGTATLTKPGVYTGMAVFGDMPTDENTARFSVQIKEAAASSNEKKLSTPQGGYVTFTNISQVQEDKALKDTLYIGEAPITVKVHGEPAKIDLGYYPENGNAEIITFANGEATLTKPGVYTGMAVFGDMPTDENTARFSVQIKGGATPAGTTTQPPAPTATTIAATATATPMASKVIVNGAPTAFEAYTIEDNNYFKLRDLAAALNGTSKQFEVGWDAEKNAINLESGKAYTAVGGELAVSGQATATEALLSTSKIYLNGQEVPLTAYTIDGNNYFKLRDLAKAINVGVFWDAGANLIGIEPSVDYTPE